VLNAKWEPRSREDHMLRSYLRRVRRAGHMGAVHAEVPFGEQRGGSARRLDAVRFPQLDNRIRRIGRGVRQNSPESASVCAL
jgi:hypothetical protein